MEKVSKYQKEALDTLTEKAPYFLELFGKALHSGAYLVDMSAVLAVKQFDGREILVTIKLNGDVEWEK